MVQDDELVNMHARGIRDEIVFCTEINIVYKGTFLYPQTTFFTENLLCTTLSR